MNTSLRSRTAVACTGLLAVIAAATAAAAPAAAAQPGPVVLSVGHVDALEVSHQAGGLAVRVKDDTGPSPVTRDPADVVLQALPESRKSVPDHPDFAFLGAPGDPVWILPQTQDPDLLWPGWNTEQLEFGVFQDDQITITLTDVDGPGAVFVYIEDFLGLPIHQFSSEPGFPDRAATPVSTHTHANWAFTTPGRYALTFQVDATLADGTPVSSGPVAYAFLVGERDGDPDPPDASQQIIAAIPELDGALVTSIDPDDRVVTMSPAELAAGGDRLISTGALRPITVTDTRPGAPGWDASGQLSDFATEDGASFGARFAGWTPAVASQADGQGVVAGPPVPPGGTGLAGSARLASAPAGSGLGTAVLGGGLRLELPTETPPGEYRALLTLTVI